MQPVSYHHHHLPVSLGSGGSEDSVCSMAFPPIYLAVLPPNQTAGEVPHQGRCSPILVGQTPVKGRISPLPAVPQVQLPGTDQVPTPVQGMQVITLVGGEGWVPGNRDGLCTLPEYWGISASHKGTVETFLLSCPSLSPTRLVLYNYTKILLEATPQLVPLVW